MYCACSPHISQGSLRQRRAIVRLVSSLSRAVVVSRDRLFEGDRILEGSRLNAPVAVVASDGPSGYDGI
jgi:hypothetical protein